MGVKRLEGNPHSPGYLDSLNLSATKQGRFLGFSKIIKDYLNPNVS